MYLLPFEHILNQPPLPHDLRRERLFTGHIQHILRGENLFSVVQHRVFSHRFISFATENQSDRRVITLNGIVVIKEAHIPIHLADIGMGEFTGFEVNQQIALENTVVEDKVDIELFVFELQPFLPPHEGKSLSQLKQK
jgi:hypothetical protein